MFTRNKLLILHVNNFKMNTKLTLNLNKTIIESAKDYAKNHKTSLSKLIENYLNSITKKENSTDDVSPLVESLTGVIPDENTNYKKEYQDFINHETSNIVDHLALIGHARLVTNGFQAIGLNNQPVNKNGIVIVHNGIIAKWNRGKPN